MQQKIKQQNNFPFLAQLDASASAYTQTRTLISRLKHGCGSKCLNLNLK